MATIGEKYPELTTVQTTTTSDLIMNLLNSAGIGVANND